MWNVHILVYNFNVKEDKRLLVEIGIQASKEAKELNLTITEYLILGVLDMYKKLCINDIAKIMYSERSTISKALKHLKSIKFIVEEKDIKDARKTIYKINSNLIGGNHE